MPPKIEHYATGAMLLHWSIAAIVFAVGFTSPFLDHRNWPALSTFHNLGGSLVLALTLWWFAWRATHQKLPNLATIDVRENHLMSIANSVLNVLLILAPISGFVYLSALGGSLGLGETTLHQVIAISAVELRWIGIVHHVLGALLVSIAGGHALHAVWHHVVLRDGLLARILPWH